MHEVTKEDDHLHDQGVGFTYIQSCGVCVCVCLCVSVCVCLCVCFVHSPIIYNYIQYNYNLFINAVPNVITYFPILTNQCNLVIMSQRL